MIGLTTAVYCCFQLSLCLDGSIIREWAFKVSYLFGGKLLLTFFTQLSQMFLSRVERSLPIFYFGGTFLCYSVGWVEGIRHVKSHIFKGFSPDVSNGISIGPAAFSG